MTLAQILNCIGLTFDIIGVIMLFKYGLPSDINKDGHIGIILDQEDEDEKERWKKYNFFSRIALTLVIVGFMFQFSSNFYGNNKTTNVSNTTNDFEYNLTQDKVNGEWGVYAMGDALCNVCPKIDFNTNSTAIVKINGEIQNIKWEKKGNVIILVNTDTNKTDRTFSDGEYELKFVQEKEYVELQLKEMKNNYLYTLRR
jgi:hypothetical protein